MKNTKKVLSVILSAVLLLTVLSTPISVFAETGDTFESYSASVDFSSYALRPAVYSKWWYNNSWPQTPNVIIRSDAEGTGHWSIPEEEGNKYLRLTKDTATDLSDSGYNNAYHKFVISPNGLKDSVVKLSANANYYVSFKYRVSNLSDNVQILLSPFDANSKNSENWSLNAGNNVGELGIDRFTTITSNTDGWKTFTGYYTPTADCNALIFRWFSQKTTDYSGTMGTGYSYTLDIDDIKIDAVSKVTVKDPSGELADAVIYGVAGETLPETDFNNYYTDENLTNKVTSFSNLNTQTIYKVAIEGVFAPQSYNVDFTNYTLNSGSAQAWGGPFFDDNDEVYNTMTSDNNTGNINRWSIVEENGNKFIRSTKENTVSSTGSGNMHTLFLVSTNGKSSGLTPIVKDGTYRLSFKYRISDYWGAAVNLSIFASGDNGSLIGGRGSVSFMENNTNVVSATANTDGWVTFERTFVATADAPGVVFRWLGDNYTGKSFIADTDDIIIERVSTVTLDDGDAETENEVIYGVPGEALPETDFYAYYTNADYTGRVYEFTNIDPQTLYKKAIDGAFVAQHSVIDFSEYTLRTSNNPTWQTNIIQSDWNDESGYKQWTMLEEDGNKYLQLKKQAGYDLVTSGYQGETIFFCNPTGKGQYDGVSDSVSLANSTLYRIKLRYRLSDLSQGVQLNLYATTNNNALVLSNNNVHLATLTANTDGWQEAEFIFTTPDLYVNNNNVEASAADNLCLRVVGQVFAENSDFGSQWENANSGHTFTLDYDCITVDRISTVTIKDANGKYADIVKQGAPGEALNLANPDTYLYYTESVDEPIEDAANYTFSNLDTQTVFYKAMENTLATPTFEKVNSSAMRVKASYMTEVSEATTIIGGKTAQIAERGILVKSATSSATLTVDATEADGVYKVSSTDFNNYYAYDESGLLTYSAVIENLNPYHAVTAVSYLKIGDSYTYTDEATYSLNERFDGYSLVWGDEFDGTSFDTAKWKYYTSATRETTYTEDLVSVSGGSLKLGLAEDENGNLYMAKGLETRDLFSYKYGYLEMRAKLPMQHGTSSSLWFCSTKSDYTAAMAEVDVFETFGEDNILKSNIHVWKNGTTTQYNQSSSHTSTPHTFANKYRANEYHTFGYEWTEDYIKMYVDGKLYMEYDLTTAYNGVAEEDMSCFRDYQIIRLGSSVEESGDNDYPDDPSKCYMNYGRDVTTILPDAFEIDYIRLYQ